MNDYWTEHISEYKIEILGYEVKSQVADLELVELSYRSFDGSVIVAKLVIPKDSNNKVLLNIHGLGTRLTDYYDVIPFALLGYTVATIDIRGQGGNSQDAASYSGDTKRSMIVRGHENHGKNLYYKNVLLDHYYLCEWLKDNQYTPKCQTINIFGGSQGGGLGLMIASLRDDVEKAVIAYPYLTDIWNALNYSSDVYEELSKFLKHSDPLGQKTKYFKEVTSQIDPINFADEIKCKVLYAVSHIDKSIPLTCQLNMYNKLSCEKQLLSYQHHGHEKLPELMDLAMDFLK